MIPLYDHTLIMRMLFTYDKPLNETHSNRIEPVNYIAALAITGAIKGSTQ